jgi:DNA-binding transcriptional regulator YdaS (Cro superfamily)
MHTQTVNSLSPEIDPAIRRAVEEAGGWRALARELGINHQAVRLWRRIPAERVRQVEAVTGIPRNVLRPDLFADPPTTRKRK